MQGQKGQNRTRSRWVAAAATVFLTGSLVLNSSGAAAEGPDGTSALAATGGQSGTTLTATKTATAHLIKTFGWDITKSVTPATWTLFAGDSGTSTYTVGVTKDAGTLSAYVDGEICVTNAGGVATEGLAIVDNVTINPSSTVVASAQVSTAAMPSLAIGASYCYPYRVDIPSGSIKPGVTYKDTANITITNHSGSLGTPKGPEPSATSVMPSSPVPVNDTITVNDTNGSSREFSGTGLWTYDKTFRTAGTYGNTATIQETKQSASASVTVKTYTLSVAKTATTSYERTWTWGIDKASTTSALTLSTGQTITVPYTVTVSATKADSNYAVNGEITVTNPAPIAATLTDVSDAFGSVTGKVTCPSLVVPANGSLVCTYTMKPTSGIDGTNTATATQQNYAYAANGTASETGTTAYSGTAPVAFSLTPSTEWDECITVSDTYSGGPQGQKVCADLSGAGSKVFTYDRVVGPYDTPGTYSVDNTASFVTNDSTTTGSDTVTIPVTIPPDGVGCTLTPGYWKTHSINGPARYDDTWAKIGGEGTLFFGSGKSYYQVLWTAPQGNAYYILASQYIAAKLSILNGASSTAAVNAAMSGAEAFFATATPSTKLTTAQKSQLTTWATLLANYNLGLVGPGHCSE